MHWRRVRFSDRRLATPGSWSLAGVHADGAEVHAIARHTTLAGADTFPITVRV